MKVLVPVDGSSYSDEALKVALDFYRSKNAAIHVISVVQSIDGLEDHEISPSRRDRHMGHMEQQASALVTRAGDFLASQAENIPLSKTVLSGASVPETIIDFAETEKVDLIVIGSRGLSVSTRFKLGSVATQVVKYSPCSVYLVKLPPV
ncbi:MAG: universal stress protein [Thermodesulfobacteriota bacterium]